MTNPITKTMTKPMTTSEICGFGIGYGIGRKYRPSTVSVSGLNQNSGFGCPLIETQLPPFFMNNILSKLVLQETKGQLISKGLFDAIVSTKKPTNFF